MVMISALYNCQGQKRPMQKASQTAANWTSLVIIPQANNDNIDDQFDHYPSG